MVGKLTFFCVASFLFSASFRSYCVLKHSDWNPCDNVVPCPQNAQQCSTPCESPLSFILIVRPKR